MSAFRCVFLVVAIGICAASAQAEIIVAGSGGWLRTNGAGTIGSLIAVGSTAQTINALGVQDVGTDGLTMATQVGLWDNTGSTLIASVTVPSGTNSKLINGYRYAALTTEVTLAANTQYLIGALVGQDREPFMDVMDVADNRIDGSTLFSAGAGFNLVASMYGGYSAEGAFTAPTSGSGPVGRWAPANATYIPEPSAIAIIATALVGLLVYAWRKRK